MEATGSDFRQTALLYQTDGWEGYQDRDAVGVLLVERVWKLYRNPRAWWLAELCFVWPPNPGIGQDDEVEEILTRPRVPKPWHVPDEEIQAGLVPSFSCHRIKRLPCL